MSLRQGELKEGYDSGSSSRTVSTQHRWSDLLNPDLSRMDFDATLLGVLRSTTEMERIKGLDDQEFQDVVDVLGQVSTRFLFRRSWFFVE